MVEEAERAGVLTRDKTIVEPTSGNTGIGLAMIAAAKGYKCLFTMPSSVSIERVLLFKAFGANVLLTPAEEGVDGAVRAAWKLLVEDGGGKLKERDLRRDPIATEHYVMLNRFDNPANPKAHYETTGREIWEQTRGKNNALRSWAGNHWDHDGSWKVPQGEEAEHSTGGCRARKGTQDPGAEEHERIHSSDGI